VFELIADEGLLISLLPNSNRAIRTHRHEEIANARDAQPPNFSLEVIEDEDFLVGVTIDHLHFAIYTCCQAVMGVFDEAAACDAVLVQED